VDIDPLSFSLAVKPKNCQAKKQIFSQRIDIFRRESISFAENWYLSKKIDIFTGVRYLHRGQIPRTEIRHWGGDPQGSESPEPALFWHFPLERVCPSLRSSCRVQARSLLLLYFEHSVVWGTRCRWDRDIIILLL